MKKSSVFTFFLPYDQVAVYRGQSVVAFIILSIVTMTRSFSTTLQVVFKNH